MQNRVLYHSKEWEKTHFSWKSRDDDNSESNGMTFVEFQLGVDECYGDRVYTSRRQVFTLNFPRSQFA